jgi:hypothetical protein
VNKLSRGWVAVLIALGLGVQVNAEKLLVDFGDAGAFRSIGVSSPDVNGNYWNGIGAMNSVSNMVNTANAPTTIGLLFTSEYGVDSYNGPAGATETNTLPTDILNTTFNADLLGDLGVTNAVFDYFSDTAVTNGLGDQIGRSNLVFRISGLNPAKYYELTFFGSKKYPSAGVPGNDIDECSARYAASGGTGTISADLQLGVFSTHNPSAVASLVMTPGVSNEITVVVSGVTTNTRAALNAMSIEILDTAPVAPEVQTMLVDFGAPPTYRSLAVESPDYNGNAWNEVAYEPVGNIVDKENRLTSVDLVRTSEVGVDSYNGPAGATSSTNFQNEVTNTVIDTVALGDLGVTNAAFDYFAGTDITFELRNLDPSKSYDLTFFGSHKYPSIEYTQYAVTDSTGMVLVATNLYVGTGADHNTSFVAALTNLTPDASNTIYVKFGGVVGGSGYLNSMKIRMSPSTVLTGYEMWAAGYGLVQGQNGDDDVDGVTNIREYGLDGIPNNFTVAPAVLPVFNVSGSGATYDHVQRNDDPDLVYIVEIATDLVASNWVSTGYTSTTNVGAGTFDTVENAIPTDTDEKFIRLIIEEL